MCKIKIRNRVTKAKEGSTNQVDFLEKDIELNIKYGYDRKKQRPHKTDSTESSSDHQDQLEQFDNEEVVANSPRQNPTVDPSKIESEELEQEMGARNVSRPNTYRQLSLLLSSVTLLKNNVVFIECFFNHGGIYFLVPYFIVLFTLGVPMAVFELSLAQYASIPMYGMFAKLAPALGGIAYLILVLRTLYTVFVALEPRFLVYMYHSLKTVITENTGWIECANYPGVRCFNPKLSCKMHEFQLKGRCVHLRHVTQLARQQDYGLLTYFSFREQRLASLIPAQIYKEVKSLDVMDNFLAALLFLLLAGLIAYKGHRFFASVSAFFVFVPVIGMIPAVVLMYYDVGSRKKHFLHEIVKNNDFWKIFHLDSWLNAARVSVKTVYIADGTLLMLGSMADFRHNFVKDAILLAASGAAYRLILCFGILPLLYISNDILYPFAKTVYADGNLVQFHAIEVFFSALPSYSVPDISPTVLFFLYAILYGTINFAFVAYQVITMEMFKTWADHMFPRLLYLKQNFIKVCLIMATITFLLFLYAIQVPFKIPSVGYQKELVLDEYIVGLVSTIVFIQLISTSICFGYKRLLINYMTMLKHHPFTYKLIERMRFVLYMMWTVFLPLACLTSMTSVIVKMFQIYSIFSAIYALISAIPLFFIVRKLTIQIVNHEHASSLSETHRWQPANEAHAREAEYDERASAVLR